MSGEPVTETAYTGSLRELLWTVSQTATWCETWESGIIASVYQRTKLGDTPLHTVCTWGFTEPVKLLILHGADVNARGEHNDTPLLRSLIGENSEVIRLLLQHGADPEFTNDFGWTPRSSAVNIGKSKGWSFNPLVASLDSFLQQRSSGHKHDRRRT